ncbi:MAG: hypothetical protein DRQ88_09290 [Epsilonproteobacteria bacterium]|nr:MAG: hypothetical protein DRQ88_09290 [Campylobacterota bacterium]
MRNLFYISASLLMLTLTGFLMYFSFRTGENLRPLNNIETIQVLVASSMGLLMSYAFTYKIGKNTKRSY